MPHSARPVIGVNVDYAPATKNAKAQLRLHPGYADAILHAGGTPLLMPPIERERDMTAFLDLCDGFLLTGGLDLDPRRLGQPNHTSIQPMPERREGSDRRLVQEILRRRMPVLGVGVGMQLLNVLCGGSLYQHLPEDLPRSLPHFDRNAIEPHRHVVKVLANTRMDEIYGVTELFVVSMHHQAVRNVGHLFRACAKAPDGVIEAIEAVDPNWFAFGVQWHPEAESASALDQQLLECFLQASIRQREPLSLVA